MADEGGDTERTAVRTYVPKYQKEQWRDHAEDLGMSQSEFVRTMVQAGRSGFEPTEIGGTDNSATDTSQPAASQDDTPGVGGMKTRVQAVLDDGGYHDWEELRTELTATIEAQLEDALQELQSEGVVTYSGRHGGYVIDE